MARFDFGDAFTRPWVLVFGNFARYLTTQGLFVFAGAVVTFAFVYYVESLVNLSLVYHQLAVGELPWELLENLPAIKAALPSTVIVGTAFGITGFGVGIVVTDALLKREQLSLGETLGRLGPSFGRLVLIILALVGVAIGIVLTGFALALVSFGVGLVAAIALLIVLALRWCLAAPAAVLGGHGVGESFRVSATATKGSKGMLLLLFVVMGLIFGAAKAAVTAPFAPQFSWDAEAVPPDQTTGALVGESVASLVVDLISGPVLGALLVILYRKLSEPRTAPAGDVAYFPAAPPPADPPVPPPPPPQSQP